MINQYSLDACTNAMRMLTESNARLRPVKGSALDVLNSATNKRLVLDTSITDEEFFRTFQASTAMARPVSEGAGYLNGEHPTVGILNIDDHEGTLHDLRQTYIQAGGSLLSFARNGMQGLVSRILKNFSPVAEQEMTESWSVQPLAPEPLLVEPLVATLLESVKDLSRIPQYIEPIAGLQVPVGLALPETGSATYDGLVNKLLKELNLTPTEVMEGLQRGDSASPGATRAFELVRRRILELLLIAYFHEHPWGDSGLALVEWEYRTRLCLYQVVGWLRRFIETMLADAGSGLVIRNYDTKTREVFVLESVLNEYFQKGGQIEAVYGLVYMREDGDTRIFGGIDSIIEHQATLMEAWQRHAVIRRKENRDDWRTINSRALKDAVRTALKSEETTDEDLNLGEGRTRETAAVEAMQRIDVFFRAVAEDVDLTAFVIDLVGGLTQEPLGAKLLTCIHIAVQQGGNPEEAATDWVVDYILDGLLDEVDIEFPSA